MPHPDLTWFCSRCCRERRDGQPHVCRTDEERLADLRKASGALVDAVLTHKAGPALLRAVSRVQRLLEGEG